jgi:hypothetical protein
MTPLTTQSILPNTLRIRGSKSPAEEQLLDPRSQKAHQHEQREPAPRAAEEGLKTGLILLKKDGKIPRQRAFWVERQGIDRCGE